MTAIDDAARAEADAQACTCREVDGKPNALGCVRHFLLSLLTEVGDLRARLAAQPAHGDNEAALRALAGVEGRMEVSVFPMPPAVPLRADNGYLSYATMLHHLAEIRAALSASAEPESGEGRG